MKDRLTQVVFVSLFVGLPLLFGYFSARIVVPSLEGPSRLWNLVRLACYVVPAMLLGFFVSLVVAGAVAVILFGVRNDVSGKQSGAGNTGSAGVSPE